MNTLAKSVLPLVDAILAPVVLPAALVLKAVRRVGLQRLRLCSRALLGVGVLPIRSHYYEPLIDMRHLTYPLDRPRPLPGIDWNIRGQLETLESLNFGHELKNIPDRWQAAGSFHFNNGAFESGDAEFWYQIIRKRKPVRIIEIGSGSSTLMARKAIAKNSEEDSGYRCSHVCIEPYEQPWLETCGVSVLRNGSKTSTGVYFSN